MSAVLQIQLLSCSYCFTPAWKTHEYPNTPIISCAAPIVKYGSERQNLQLAKFQELSCFRITQIYVSSCEQINEHPSLNEESWIYLVRILKQLSKSQKFVNYIEIKKPLMCSWVLKSIKACQWKFLSIIVFQQSCIKLQEVLLLSQIDTHYLTKLFLARNLIRSKGALILAKRIYHFLKYVDLSYNPLENKGLKNICKARWPKLEKLKVNKVHATPEVLRYFNKYQGSMQLLEISFRHMSLKMLGNMPLVSSFSIIIGLRAMDCPAELIIVNSVSKKEYLKFQQSETKPVNDIAKNLYNSFYQSIQIRHI